MSAGRAGLPLVLVMVGTDYHPFDRLVSWADEWAGAHRDVARTFIQFGHAAAPAHAEGSAFVSRPELDEMITRATVVVGHGGPSTMVETRRRGLTPIVVARDPRRGEHVDQHQRRFSAAMARRGMLRLVDDRAALHAAMDSALVDPLHVVGGHGLPDPADAAQRLGAMVDGLLADRAARAAGTSVTVS